MNSRRLQNVLAPIALAALAVGAAACGDDDSGGGSGGGSGDGDVTVTEVWAREPAVGADRLAVYGVVSNESGDDITLVGAESSVGSTVELHETNVDDAGTMSMAEREDGFSIRAGDVFVLEPGGAHVMIFEVAAGDLGESFDVTFDFDGADDVTAEVELVALGAGDDGDMDEMDENDMDDMDDMDEPDDGDGDG